MKIVCSVAVFLSADSVSRRCTYLSQQESLAVKETERELMTVFRNRAQLVDSHVVE